MAKQDDAVFRGAAQAIWDWITATQFPTSGKGHDPVVKGVDQAFWDFIHNHRDVSTLDAITSGVEKALERNGIDDAFSRWLDDNPDMIHTAIKEAVIEWLDRHGGPKPHRD